MDNDDYEEGYKQGEDTAEAVIKNYHYLVATGQLEQTAATKKGFIEAFKNTIGQWNAE